jgi:hypothetical protein
VLVGGRGYRYGVRVEHGRVGCKSARSVLRSFIATSTTPPGWVCFRGHSSDAWAAACAGVSAPLRNAVIRAYLVAR